MYRLHHLARAASLAVALTLLVAGTALAVPPQTVVRNGLISFSVLDTGMCTFEVEVSFEGKVTRTDYFDSDGALVRTVINVRYIGTFDGPGATVDGAGTRHILFDWVSGIRSESGAYRAVTGSGVGIVLQEAGRMELDIETESNVLFEAGFHDDWYGDFDAICSALAG